MIFSGRTAFALSNIILTASILPINLLEEQPLFYLIFFYMSSLCSTRYSSGGTASILYLIFSYMNSFYSP
jgi:hypothetical protein